MVGLKIFRTNLLYFKICMYLCSLKTKNAEIAQLVEHDLAKVGVAGSSPVFRSAPGNNSGFFYDAMRGFVA